MQVISVHPLHSHRYDADEYADMTQFAPGIDPNTGCPQVIVHDFSDEPFQSRPGYAMVFDIDPTSRTYRRVIEVSIESGHPMLRALQQHQENRMRQAVTLRRANDSEQE